MSMPAKIAVFGDVHGNIDALETVLADCLAQGVDSYLCTGDVVGYGARPRECIAKVRALGCPVVKGNHDLYAASTESDTDDFNPTAALAMQWTRDALDAGDIAWLDSLPFSVVKTGIALVHSTMDKPKEFGYVFDNKQAEANFAQQTAPLCFHGHTHCPIIFEKHMAGVYRIDPQELEQTDFMFKLAPGRKYFINVGSVGQPRDGDRRATYAIYSPKERTVRFRRLEYDIAAAQAKILEAGLPPRLAERLASGR